MFSTQFFLFPLQINHQQVLVLVLIKCFFPFLKVYFYTKSTTAMILSILLSKFFSLRSFLLSGTLFLLFQPLKQKVSDWNVFWTPSLCFHIADCSADLLKCIREVVFIYGNSTIVLGSVLLSEVLLFCKTER